MIANEIRNRAVAIAKSEVGLSANPADPALRQRYLDLIAPGETAQTQSEMAEMSGCGLVVAGIWRALGVKDARLDPPYKVGTALSRLVSIAQSAGAWVAYAAGKAPSPGDMVLVGDNASGGVQHVYTVTEVRVDAGKVTITSVDGGQRDTKGYQTILTKNRRWDGSKDVVDGSSARVIVGWADVTRLPIAAGATTTAETEPAPEPQAASVGAPGADSAGPVTTAIGGKTLVTLATELFGAPPAFWGRYFTSTSTTGNVEYRHKTEDASLRAANIKVAPLARQTPRVGGSEQDGRSDGEANAKDLIATFGSSYLAAQGGQFYMFLDVEGAPSLSTAYYTGWTKGLASGAQGITIHPCVYATQYDAATWRALAAACASGVACKGLWVAHWTQAGAHAPDPWSDTATAPVAAVPAKVLIWQYANDAYGAGSFDCNQVNPGIDLQKDLLRYLVLPPG